MGAAKRGDRKPVFRAPGGLRRRLRLLFLWLLHREAKRRECCKATKPKLRFMTKRIRAFHRPIRLYQQVAQNPSCGEAPLCGCPSSFCLVLEQIDLYAFVILSMAFSTVLIAGIPAKFYCADSAASAALCSWQLIGHRGQPIEIARTILCRSPVLFLICRCYGIITAPGFFNPDQKLCLCLMPLLHLPDHTHGGYCLDPEEDEGSCHIY